MAPALAATHNINSLSIIDREKFAKKKIRYFYVDKTGCHCFLISQDSVHYLNFYNRKEGCVQEIFLGGEAHEGPLRPNELQNAKGFTCMDLNYTTESDNSFFELLLGHHTGSIWHGCYEFDPHTGELYNFAPLRCILDGKNLSYHPILDMKIVK